MNATPTIIGVGSPIVDTIAQVEESALSNISGAKGGMELVASTELDRLIKGLSGKTVQSPGGSSGNTLFALARLGQSSTFLGKTGNDVYGTFYRESFQALGGDSSRFKIGDTPNGRCLSLVTPDGQRTLRTDLGAAMTLSPEEISPSDFAGCTHAHIEGYLLFNRNLMLRILDSAKTAGCTISLDLASFEVVEASRDILDSLLTDYIDLVFANEEEAAAYAGADASPEAALAKLSERCDIAAVKVGADGAWIHQKQQTIHCPAKAVERVVDTTGAGDFWAAGFLYGWVRGYTPETCAHFGALLGSEVVQIDGTTLSDACWQQLRQQISG